MHITETMDDNTRVTVRLPTDMVERLEEMVIKGKYANISEAIRDCIQEYLDSNPVVKDEIGNKVPEVELESLVKDDSKSMEELIRDAAKKYTKNHIDS